MNKWILYLLSATMLCAATPDAKTEKEVMAAMEAYKQALIKRDADALSKVLSDDVVYTHSSNLHQDKAAVLESLKGPTFAEGVDFKDLKVHVYGNTAVVVGDVDFHNVANGTSSTIRLNILHVLVKGPKGWQLVARQAVRYPDTAPAGKK
jgi:ketosteroid isomerase-like protein